MSGPSLFGDLFLSAGAMKAGTTWLYAVLRHHPGLHFTLEKEIHYFYHRYVDSNVLSDARRLREAKTRYLAGFDPENARAEAVRRNVLWTAAYLSDPVDDLWYRNLFTGRRREIWNCDFSNLYAHLPAEAWSRIAGDCHRLRVLYTLRHPVKRLWSHVKFQLQVNGKLDSLDAWGPEELEAFARQDFLWKNNEYGQALRAMHAGLPEGALKVNFFEDIHQDPRAILAGIEDFLGLPRFDYPAEVVDRKINESSSHPMPAYFPDLFATDVERIIGEVEATGLTVPASWRAPIPAQ